MPPKDGSKDSLLAALTDFHLKFTFSPGLRMFKRGCWAKSGKGESKKTKKWTPVPRLPQEAGKFQSADGPKPCSPCHVACLVCLCTTVISKQCSTWLLCPGCKK